MPPTMSPPPRSFPTSKKSVTSHLRSLRYCPLPASPLDPSPQSRTILSRLHRMRRLLCHHPRRSQIRVEACRQEISSKSCRRTIGQHKCYPCCRSSCYQVQSTKIRPCFLSEGLAEQNSICCSTSGHHCKTLFC